LQNLEAIDLKQSFKCIASVGFAFAKLCFALQNLEAIDLKQSFKCIAHIFYFLHRLRRCQAMQRQNLLTSPSAMYGNAFKAKL